MNQPEQDTGGDPPSPPRLLERAPREHQTMSSMRESLDLAALHRELAANIPSVGGFPGGTGSAADRNVELLISPPFPVDRLPGA